MSQDVADAISPGRQREPRMAGNLLACRAVLVFLDALEQGGRERVRAAGARLTDGLEGAEGGALP